MHENKKRSRVTIDHYFKKKQKLNTDESYFTYFSVFTGIGVDNIAMERVFPNSRCVGYSEIDETAIKIYQHHYPDHKNFGDITKINFEQLPKFDILIGGSPCQGFSQAGHRKGFQDDRSVLVEHFVKMIQLCKPKYFILENVASMKLADRDRISAMLKCKPVLINSNLVTAQNRRRYYWCNFPLYIPRDKKIMLRDVLQPSEKCFDRKIIHKTDLIQLSHANKNSAPFAFTMTRIASQRGNPNAKCSDFRHIIRVDGKSNPVICAKDWTSIIFDGTNLRNLSCEEMEMLQTLPVGYTEMIDERQRKKYIGNSFTTNVIVHILKCLKNNLID